MIIDISEKLPTWF